MLDLQPTLMRLSPWRNGTSSASVSSLFNCRVYLCVLFISVLFSVLIFLVSVYLFFFIGLCFKLAYFNAKPDVPV